MACTGRKMALQGSAALLAAALAGHGAARADEPPQDAAAARREGAARAARRDFQGCAEAYRRALRVAPDPLVSGELGLCEEALGLSVAAFDDLRRALEAEPAPGKGGGRGVWRRYHDALDRLQRRVARAIVLVRPGTAEVFVDGVSIGTHVSGRYVTLAPGDHTWTARAQGYAEETFSHTVRGGDLPDVALLLERVARPAEEVRREEPVGKGPEPPGRDAAAPPRGPAPREGPAPASQGRPSPPREPEPTLSWMGGGLVSAGLTLDAGAGIVVGGGARWGAFNALGFSVGLEVRALLPAKAAVLTGRGSLSLAQVTLGVAPCVRYRWAAGCVTLDGGLLFGGGTDPGAGDLWPALGIGPRLGVEVPLFGYIGVLAFADLRLSPISGSGFQLGRQGFSVPVVSGLFGVGLSFGKAVRP